MGLDVWFQEDVARVLRAARVAGREAQVASESAGKGLSEVPGTGEAERQDDMVLMTAYWRGYEAALATIGAAFGLSPGASLGEARRVLAARPSLLLPSGRGPAGGPGSPKARDTDLV